MDFCCCCFQNEPVVTVTDIQREKSEKKNNSLWHMTEQNEITKPL